MPSDIWIVQTVVAGSAISFGRRGPSPVAETKAEATDAIEATETDDASVTRTRPLRPKKGRRTAD